MKDPKLPYDIIHSKSIYQGSIVHLVKDQFILHQDPEKKVITRLLVKHPGAVVIVPFLDRRTILLIRQFRYSAQGDLWEIPAGTVEIGENPLACAKREIEEETGYKAKSWKKWAVFYPAPGISNEIMTLYGAHDLFEGKKNLDADEWIAEPVPTKLSLALKMIQNGQIRDGKTIAGILWANQFYP